MLSKPRVALLSLSLILLFWHPLLAAEYFVATHGSDTNDGTTLQKPLATIQKGLDLLKPGDTLTLAPGEYRQSAHREKFGSLEQDTTIRALIPGTAVLRGDVPISGFTKTPTMRKVYQIPFDQPVQTVNELDTLTVLRSAPYAAELDLIPGSFYYDATQKMLYISGSDWRDPARGHYSATVTPLDGLWFGESQRVIIDGLAFTGFNSTMPNRYTPPYRNRYSGMGAAWGVLMTDCQSSVIRNCTAYLNGGGIAVEYLLEPKAPGQFPNTIERCTAYGTFAQLYTYETSAIGVYQANGDMIRDCTAYLNKSFGIRFYLNPFAIGSADRCTAWGNYHDNDPADLQVKASKSIRMTRSIATGWATAQSGGFNILPEEQADELPGNIILRPTSKPAVNIEREFADPLNFDYRLQPNSVFRKAAPDGADAGIAPYEANIYYVNPDGNDDADGLSTNTAWKTLGRALKQRSPGDTVYLFPGTYSHSGTLTFAGTPEKPVALRTRGLGTAVIEGNLSFNSSNHLTLERLTFTGTLRIESSAHVTLRQSVLLGNTLGLAASKSPSLNISNNIFTGFSAAGLEADKASTALRLQGNLFDNRPTTAAALKLADASAVLYSDYNAFTNLDRAWSIASQPWPMSRVRESGEVYSRQFTPEFGGSGSTLNLSNAAVISVAGGLGKPIGTYRDKEFSTAPRVIDHPTVHSVSATTANIEWLLNQNATVVLQWGPTPACENTETFDVSRWGTFSMTGLSPNTAYYFKLKSISSIKSRDATVDPPVVTLNTKPLMARTLATDAPVRTYYVSPTGSDDASGTAPAQAWKSLNRAAAAVLPGDTVLIASGRYKERIRIRATGDVNRPITFKCLPGQRVIIDGAGKSISNGFVINLKKHLKFDGFYFVDSNMFPDSGPIITRAGEFFVYRSSDISISRCYSDARNSYTAAFLVGHRTERLTLSNSVMVSKFDGVYIEKCHELRIENCVFASPLIAAMIHRNSRTDTALLSNNIFVDMLNKKAVQNFGMLTVDGYTDSFRMDNNCFFLRCFTPADRKLMNTQNLSEAAGMITNAMFENPKFAGVARLIAAGQRRMDFEPDILTESPTMLDFDAYFATNPAVVSRSIGLQPEAFKDFNFSAAGSNAQ